MIEVGDILICPAMKLKVKDMRGTWVKCDYLNWDGEWKPRGCTENRKRLEESIKNGTITIAE